MNTSNVNRKPKQRSPWWNGCFVMLALAWGVLLIVGFATTFDGPTWSRFGGAGSDVGSALVFFAGLGILFGIKRAAETMWDWLTREESGSPPDSGA